MSYTRRFSRTIHIPYSGSTTVSYPPSQNGGTKTVYYNGVASDDVNVDIYVNTAPFDASVANCNNQVNGLTASVGAMNAAQCMAINENANKVSQTIINGFFKSVKTDLSTQKAELEQKIEAKLLLLRQQAASLRERQRNMAEDYARTCARYQKIFTDINNELSVRIHAIDQPIFNMAEEVDAQNGRMLHTDMVQTAVTMSKESSILQAQINAAAVKSHALQAMAQAQQFLHSKALTEKTLQGSTIEGSGEQQYLIPVCFMQTETDSEQKSGKCYAPSFITAAHVSETQLCERLKEMPLPSQTESERELLQSYMQSEISNKITGTDEHSSRVRAQINKLFTK